MVEEGIDWWAGRGGRGDEALDSQGIQVHLREGMGQGRDWGAGGRVEGTKGLNGAGRATCPGGKGVCVQGRER